MIRKGLAVSLARSVKSKLKLGICGEHGGDPASIAFCHSQGLTYVSCSPFRVPLTRLAAAQAAIKASGHSLTQDK
ncbi:TPA: putative PEP-binding protein [Streptococcus pyogenes]